MNVLLVNAGSSSLKIALRNINSEEALATASVNWSGPEVDYRLCCGTEKISKQVTAHDPATALRLVLRDLNPLVTEHFASGLEIGAVGHRVVHGGDLTSSVLITDEVMGQLQEISVLAPLHNPPSLAVIAAAREELPDLPHFAIFDTAFHRSMLPEAEHYAIPPEWSDQLKIKRYGFHGLSHSYCAWRAAKLLGRPAEHTKVIICHLGAGCSASAVSAGRCLDTTMGFTPLEGLMMATRSGSIDPGAVLYLQQQYGIGAEEVLKTLNSKSGLLGVSGISADMRQVQSAADQGNPRAQLAISMFCYRVRQAIGSLLVTLGGADALVFTAGIGENSPQIRENICRDLGFLGFAIDPELNRQAKLNTDIATANSSARILVLESREDLSMLHQLRPLLCL